MKSAVELNSFLLKFFCYVTWFDQRRNRKACKGGSTEDNSIRFIVKGGLTQNDLYDTIYMTLLDSATRKRREIKIPMCLSTPCGIVSYSK